MVHWYGSPGIILSFLTVHIARLQAHPASELDICDRGSDGPALWLLQRGSRYEARKQAAPSAGLRRSLAITEDGSTIVATKLAAIQTAATVRTRARASTVPQIKVKFYRDASCNVSDDTDTSLPVSAEHCSLTWNYTCSCVEGEKVVIAENYYPSCTSKLETDRTIIPFNKCVPGEDYFGTSSNLWGFMADRGTCPCCKATPAECTIYGDPHIMVFDQGNVSVPVDNDDNSQTNASMLEMAADASGPAINEYEEQGRGNFWLIKSEQISVQAKYRKVVYPKATREGEHTFLVSLAIGGPFLKDHRMIIEPKEGSVRWGHMAANTEEILTTFSEEFRVLDLLTARSKNQTQSVEHPELTSSGIELDLPNGVTMIVNRHLKHLDASIRLPDRSVGGPGGIDGQCGNFNGDPLDDTANLIQERIGFRIPKGQLLFDS